MDSISMPLLRMMAERFKLLGSPTRLDILQHLCEQERSVGDLVEITGYRQANVSKQLGMLSQAGLVLRRSEGNFHYYRVADDLFPELCELVHSQLRHHQGEVTSHVQS